MNTVFALSTVARFIDNRQLFFICLTMSLLVGIGWQCRPRPVPTERVRATFDRHHVELDSAVSRLQRAVDARQPGPAVQVAFRQARLAYKRLEWLTAYYSPLTTKALNVIGRQPTGVSGDRGGHFS
jgi:cytochrome c peroxidase